jgi:hypothetical protein
MREKLVKGEKMLQRITSRKLAGVSRVFPLLARGMASSDTITVELGDVFATHCKFHHNIDTILTYLLTYLLISSN